MTGGEKGGKRRGARSEKKGEDRRVGDGRKWDRNERSIIW